MNKIPVFYHRPKNAGTYVSDWMLIAFRHYRRTYTDWLKTRTSEWDTIKSIRIVENGFIIARVLVGDPEHFCDDNPNLFIKYSNAQFDTDLKNLTKEFFDNIFLFGIIIEGRGFALKEEVLNLFEKYIFHEFLLLRDSFSRAQSLYNYIISASSKHEKTHGLIKSSTFESYIMSEQLEDSWLIRQFAKIEDQIPINKCHFNTTIDTLTSFKLYSVKDVEQAIRDTFLECYDFDIRSIILKPWDTVTKNKTNEKKIKIDELPLKAQQTFNQRVYWDNKLYNTFLNK